MKSIPILIAFVLLLGPTDAGAAKPKVSMGLAGDMPREFKFELVAERCTNAMTSPAADGFKMRTGDSANTTWKCRYKKQKLSCKESGFKTTLSGFSDVTLDYEFDLSYAVWSKKYNAHLRFIRLDGFEKGHPMFGALSVYFDFNKRKPDLNRAVLSSASYSAGTRLCTFDAKLLK